MRGKPQCRKASGYEVSCSNPCSYPRDCITATLRQHPWTPVLLKRGCMPDSAQLAHAHHDPHLSRLHRARLPRRPWGSQSHQEAGLARDTVFPRAHGYLDEWRCGARAVELGRGGSADAVIVGSGIKTREIVNNPTIMSALDLDPARQLIGAQCQARWCCQARDARRRPRLHRSHDEALGPGGWGRGTESAVLCCGEHCHRRRLLASQYLAAWIIARLEGEEAASAALHYVAPVGEKEEYVSRAMKNIAPYLQAQ